MADGAKWPQPDRHSVIDHFKPEYLINIGTCGGIEGRINRFDIVAVERAVIYDIHETMGDSQEAIAQYTTDLKVPRRLPPSVIRTTIYSADRDLTSAYLRDLVSVSTLNVRLSL